MKDAAKVNKHVVFGGIVHKAIEKFTEAGPAVNWAWDEWDKEMSGPYIKRKRPPKDFNRMLGNYFLTIAPKIQGKKMNKIEHFFRLPWEHWNGDEEVQILGKIDRISDEDVYDWKTGTRRPAYNQLQDIQFYFYEWAYEKEFGQRPTNIYYGLLQTAELIKVEMKDELRSNLITLTNYVLDNLNREKCRNIGYQCGSCFYKDTCFSEIDIGVGLKY